MVSIIFGFFLFYYSILSTSPACSLDISVPEDYTICELGNYNLNGEINGDYLDFNWTSDEGYLNDSDLDPSVFIDGTETFTLCARSIDNENLITNGDFESGQTGFTSDYVYNPSTGVGGLAQGSYNIDVVTPFLWTNCPPISGQMMVVNAATITNVDVYCTVVNVNPNTDYIFSTDVMNINNPPPILQFSINGALLGSPFTGGDPCVPDQFYETWNSGASTSATICIVNQNTAGSGNDFALDNVNFNELCVFKESYTISYQDFEVSIGPDVILTCENPTTTLFADVENPHSVFTYDWDSSDGNIIGPDFFNSIEVDEQGTYQVTVTDENMCTREASIFISGDFNLPSFDLIIPDTLNCTNDSILLSIINSGNNNIEWINPSNELIEETSFFTQDSGVYTVVLTHPINGCVDSAFINVALDTGVIAQTLNLNHILDCENDSAQISFILNGDIEDFTWYLEELAIEGGDSLTVENGGNYYLETTFENGCTHIDSIFVYEHIANFDYQISFDSLINCSQDSALILTDLQSPNQDLIWNGPGVNNNDMDSFFITQGGWYYLTIVDSLNCIEFDSILINEDFVYPTFNENTDTLNCDKAEVLIEISDLDVGTTVDWIGPNNEMYNGSQIMVSNEGLYDYEVTSSNGCSETGSILVIDESDNLDFSLESNILELNCADLTSEISVVDNLYSGDTYDWIFGGEPYGSTSTINVSEAGIYYLEITDENGCSGIAEIEIGIDTLAPIVMLVGDTINCINSFTTISVVNPSQNIDYSFYFDGELISNTTNITWDEADLIEIVAISENGCASIDSFQILIDTLVSPDLIALTDTLQCNKNDASLELENLDFGSTVIWTGPNGEEYFGENILVEEAGMYVYEVTASNGCSLEGLINVVDESQDLLFSLTSDVEIIDCLNGSSNIGILNNSFNNVNYSWSSLGGEIGSDSSINVTNTGVYSLVVTDENECTGYAEIEIQIDTIAPNLSLIGNVINCINTSAIVEVVSSEDNVEYSFYSGGDLIGEESSITWNNADLIEVVATGENGCSTAEFFQIQIDTFVDQFILSADSITCQNTEVQIEINPVIENYSYQWSSGNMILSNQEEFFTSESGIYELITTNEENGCSSIASIEVFRNENLPYALLLDILNPTCGETDFGVENFEILGGVSPYQISLNGELVDETMLENLLNEGINEINIIDNNLCSYDTSFTLILPSELELNLVSNIEIQAGTNHQLLLEINKDLDEIESIIWNDDTNLSCGDCIDPIVNISETETLEVTVIDIYGCIAFASITIQVAQEINVYIPNVFAPYHQNNINGVFKALGNEDEIESIEFFEIFDRWGNNIFSQSDIDYTDPTYGWDGLFNGEEVETGVYVFVIEVVFFGGEKRLFAGDFTLVN